MANRHLYFVTVATTKSATFDLDAYYARLGLSGRPSFSEVHRSHVHAIPFENLDSHRGQPVSLERDDLFEKLVLRQRGGYCFEHNLLLKAACEARGADVQTYLARVRWRAPAGTIRPRAHLVLAVRLEGETWHADVGFGAGTPLEPMPFGPGGPYEQSGWTYRLIEEGPELVLQRRDGDDWADVYSFSTEPSPLVDVETSNWFVATNPDSPFRSGLIVSRRPLDGSIEILSDWSGEMRLTTETVNDTTTIHVDEADVGQLLSTRFALPGFGLTSDGRVDLLDA